MGLQQSQFAARLYSACVPSRSNASGAEFSVAMEEARVVGAKILLGDQPVDITLNRLAEAIRATGIKGFWNAELGTPEALKNLELDSSKDSIAVAVEAMKQRDTVDQLTSQMKSQLPLVYRVMIDERDEYMSRQLSQYLARTPGAKTACAVVGIAHLAGIERLLMEDGCKLASEKSWLASVFS